MQETYKEFIQNILDTRGRFACGDEYHERHHIVPKSCGGTNNEDNLIDLYAREHFIAHKLLALENLENNSLVYAWNCMAFFNTKRQKRYELTPEEYEEARIALSKAMTGRALSEETKEKIRQSKLGKKHSEESKRKMSESCKGEKSYWYGKHLSEDARVKLSESQKRRLSNPENNPMYGRPWWDENTTEEKINEWREHKSEAVSGDKNPNYGNHWSQDIKDKIRDSESTTKIVIQFDKSKKIITEHPSIRQAERNTGLNRTSISMCCNYKRITCGGCFWMFKSEYEKYGRLITKCDM